MLCGDVNIAHQEIDLKNFKGNKKNSGFLPEGDLGDVVTALQVARGAEQLAELETANNGL